MIALLLALKSIRLPGGTLDTERSPTEGNLPANLTAWTVLQNEATFTALFE